MAHPPPRPLNHPPRRPRPLSPPLRFSLRIQKLEDEIEKFKEEAATAAQFKYHLEHHEKELEHANEYIAELERAHKEYRPPMSFELAYLALQKKH